jgi:hypothetical protein
MTGTTPIDINKHKTTLDKVKKHVRDNQDLYLVSGVSATLSIFLYSKFRKPPRVDEAAIVWKWMQHQVENGFSIYSLTPEQKKLWETAWQFVEFQVDRGWGTRAEVIAQMVKDYEVYLPKAA